MNQLAVRNRQRTFRIASRKYKTMASLALKQLFGLQQYQLSVTFLSAKSMAAINESHLQHQGPTDIITFDYSDSGTLDGELLICPEVAVGYAARYQVTLGHELARYFIHGILHLQGYDDLHPADRKLMKREENRLLQHLSALYPINSLAHG